MIGTSYSVSYSSEEILSSINNESPPSKKPLHFLRYPGGKQRMVAFIISRLSAISDFTGRYFEPFVGGAALFFALNPKKAVISDLNHDLINLYIGIRNSPKSVWNMYETFPSTKEGYYSIRAEKSKYNGRVFEAARMLYLNRTCFKGMWRHNSKGEFTVGYGGQDRRWVISEKSLVEVSNRLKNSTILWSDFEVIIDSCVRGDFVFVDPPYKPFEKQIDEAHYIASKFSFIDQKRLAKALIDADRRGVKWAMTNSSHQEIMHLYNQFDSIKMPLGTGKSPGQVVSSSGEVLVTNL